MTELFSAILRQYLTLYTGAFLLSIYYKMTKQKITYKDITKPSDYRINTLRYKAYYVGLVFWMVLTVILVWIIN